MEFSKEELIDLQRARSIIEDSQDAVISKTLQGIITSWNAGAERLFGYTAAQAVGNPMLIVIPDDRTHEETQFLRRVGVGERIESFETIRKNKRGELIEVSVTLSPMRDSNGAIVGVSKIARDLTERRASERANAAQDRALLAARTRTDLMVSLSHELRTPLHHIMGFSQTLMLDASPVQSAHIAAIEGAAAKLIEQLNGILDSVDIDNGRIAVVDSHFSVKTALDRLLMPLCQSAHDRQIELIWHCLPNIGELTIGDEKKFSRMLGLLVDNAIKFTRVGSVHVQANAVVDGVEVVVTDTGCGMSPEGLKDAFKPLTQLDKGMSRSHGGIGMGCALAKQLAHLMGGTIEASSIVGVGTTIFVRLPFRAVTKQVPKERRLNILAVDDVALNLVLLCAIYGKQHDVTTVSNGPDALLSLEKNMFDVVLMDIQMPGMDGLETTRRWRTLELEMGRGESQRTPIIAVTANDSEQDRRNAAHAGMDGFVAKPCTRNTLNHAMQAAGVG